MEIPAPPPGATLSEEFVSDLRCLRPLTRKVLWLGVWMIHHANHVRRSRDGLKVGGHQASSAWVATLLTAPASTPCGRRTGVAAKPHASPVFHAVQYPLGNQTQDQLARFRGFGYAQSNPSRTKDADDIDFSTGSVGLGVAMIIFAALVQDYVRLKRFGPDRPLGRMIAIAGNAEFAEGNIFAALVESWKHDVRNVWWIVDYNRQSLDAVMVERFSDRLETVFRNLDWRVETLKYGCLVAAAFQRPGGDGLRQWIDSAAWREELLRDLGDTHGIRALLAGLDVPAAEQQAFLGSRLNRWHIFRRRARGDLFKDARILSARKPSSLGQRPVHRARDRRERPVHPAGGVRAQDTDGNYLAVCLPRGAAENRPRLGAGGNFISITVLSEPLFGERLLPIETVYDPFISRGLDALNYACYQDARFIVVGNLPGVSLAAEGGAHQSIYEPLLGMAQPCLTSFGRPTPTSCARSCAGASSTSRPTTAGRPICACRRARWINRSGGWTRGWRGRQRTAAYCLAPPGPRAEVALVASGAVLQEALETHRYILEDVPDAGLLVVTLVDRLDREPPRPHRSGAPGQARRAAARTVTGEGRADHRDRRASGDAVVAGVDPAAAGDPAQCESVRAIGRSAGLFGKHAAVRCTTGLFPDSAIFETD